MKNTLSAVILFLLVALVAFGAFQLSQLYQRPLAEPLNLQVANVDRPAAAEARAARPAQQGTCGETGQMLILFTGADFSGGVPPLGADAVRFLKVDFDDPAIVSVAFPRDLWLQTPALKPQNIDATRLGLAYYFKKEATQGAEKQRITAATGVVAQTLVDNFEVAPEKYFTLQLDNVTEMINTIGGVPIVVPEAFTNEYGVHFPKGEQVLDGYLSSEFVRSYKPGGDAARRQRQTLFARALQDRVVSADVLVKVPELIEQFDEAVVTDLSPKQLVALACMSKEVPTTEVEYYEIDETLTASREVGEFDPVLDPKVQDIIARLKEWLDL